MSRRRLPRRTLTKGAAALAVLAALFVAAPNAFGQADTAQRERETGARTTIGAPNATACMAALAAGDSSDEAMAFCNRAVESENLPRATRLAIRINRGAMHLRRREGTEALADFDAVIATDRRNAEAYLNRGMALIMINQPGQAVASITQALSLGVQNPHIAYFNRGAAREQLGDLRGAYEDYTTALEIRPDWGPANQELARFVRGRRDTLAQTLSQSGTP